MNSANALSFLTLGIAMWALPVVFPGWFPATALDGSSTRALWLEVMGLVQAGLGAWYLLSQYAPAFRRATSAQPDAERGRDAVAALAAREADYATPLAEPRGFAPTPEPVGSITLQGEHAELWRAINQALRADGHVRQLAARLTSLVQADRTTAPMQTAAATDTRPLPLDEENVIAFAWEQEAPTAETGERELVAEEAA